MTHVSLYRQAAAAEAENADGGAAAPEAWPAHARASERGARETSTQAPESGEEKKEAAADAAASDEPTAETLEACCHTSKEWKECESVLHVRLARKRLSPEKKKKRLRQIRRRATSQQRTRLRHVVTQQRSGESVSQSCLCGNKVV